MSREFHFGTVKGFALVLAASAAALAGQPAVAQYYGNYNGGLNNGLNEPSRTTYQGGYRIQTYEEPSPYQGFSQQRTTIQRQQQYSPQCSFGLC